MSALLQISTIDLANEYFPAAAVRKAANAEIMTFNWYQVIFQQEEILALWRACNYYHLKPVAKTFFGKISSIRITHED